MSASDSARGAALRILCRIEKSGEYADTLIDAAITVGEMPRNEAALLNEIVLGVLRRRGTIDYLIAAISDRELSKTDQTLLNCLRIALYQLIYLDRIPESAAVNESVKLAKAVSEGGAKFVNAVLRNYLRKSGEITFPDIAIKGAAAIAAIHSAPEWLATEWIQLLGVEEAAAAAESFSEKPPLTLRCNLLKSTTAGLLDFFTSAGVPAEQSHISPNSITLNEYRQINTLPGFKDGLFAVQDESSQIAAELLGAKPGEKILDACAAPGGKSAAIAAFMHNSGVIVANDLSPKKLPLIAETAERLGIDIIRTTAMDMRNPLALNGELFDRIYVDAPCSGLGVIRRNPEIKWRLTPADLSRLASIQLAILNNLAQRLKSGGVLLYSTCSTSHQENESVVDAFLDRNSSFALENLKEFFPEYAGMITERGEFRSWSHRDRMDGFFAARLIKQ